MVSVFFLCQHLGMDMEKLFDKLTDSKDIKDIPVDYIFRVTVAVFEIINSGDCFYKED